MFSTFTDNQHRNIALHIQVYHYGLQLNGNLFTYKIHERKSIEKQWGWGDIIDCSMFFVSGGKFQVSGGNSFL